MRHMYIAFYYRQIEILFECSVIIMLVLSKNKGFEHSKIIMYQYITFGLNEKHFFFNVHYIHYNYFIYIYIFNCVKIV